MTKDTFKELFDQYFDEIRNYLYYRSADGDLSTDLAQDTFLTLWEKRSRIYAGKERGLLYKIAGDLYLSYLRREKIQKNNAFSFHLEKEEGTPEQILVYEELREKYEKALAELPEGQRVVFLMSRMDDLKYREIAERLGVSVKAVEKRMTLALMNLRKLMNDQ